MKYLDTITTGDALDRSCAIPDESIDLIFTDPPYLKEYLFLYDWLGQEAARVLKPGGFLLVYVGSIWKYENMMQLGRHLTFFYDYVTLHAGQGPVLWARHTVSRHKSILAFVKGHGQPRCMVLSAWTGGGKDKRYHQWGQDEATARYFIECFSHPGGLVWEPFAGGGTVPVVCKQIQRRFLAFEIDETVAERARKRLAMVQPMLFQPETVSQMALEVKA